MNNEKTINKSAKRLMKSALAISVFSVSFQTALSAGMEDIISSNSQLGAQFVTTDVDYRERVDGQKIDSENGFVSGYGFSFSAMKDLLFGHDYLAFQFSQLNGETNYVGSSNSYPAVVTDSAGFSNYGSVKQANGAKLIDFSGRLGKGFEITDTILVTPYVEVGHHNWQRKIDTPALYTVFNPPSNLSKESYNNFYYGFGAMAQIAPIDKLVFTANAMVGSTFSSVMTLTGGHSYAVGAVNGSDGKYNLGGSVLYKVGLSADYAIYKNFHVNAGAEYIEFDYGKSQMVGYSYEPFSQTNYTTVRAGIGYAF